MVVVVWYRYRTVMNIYVTSFCLLEMRLRDRHCRKGWYVAWRTKKGSRFFPYPCLILFGKLKSEKEYENGACLIGSNVYL